MTVAPVKYLMDDLAEEDLNGLCWYIAVLAEETVLTLAFAEANYVSREAEART